MGTPTAVHVHVRIPILKTFACSLAVSGYECMFFVAKKDYSKSNHQSSGTVGAVHVCVGVLVVFWIFYLHVMCKLFRHLLSKLLGCCTVSLCATVSVQVFQLTLSPLKLTVK